LGSHLSPAETACYLTSDMFYVEVLLCEDGGVEDVKLAQHKEAPVVINRTPVTRTTALLLLHRLNKFEEFSVKLEHLNSLYSIPVDSETKIKLHTALRCLEKDLVKISNLPRPLKYCNPHVDTVLSGRTGKIIQWREGTPMSLKYFMCPFDLLEEKPDAEDPTSGHTALVTAGVSSSLQRLPMSSLISQPPQIDTHGLPVFSELGEDNSALLPACFIFKLNSPLPVMSSFVHKIEQVTGMGICEGGLQKTFFPQLLLDTFVRANGCTNSWARGDAHFVMLPENQVHSYILSGTTDGVTELEGVLVHHIAFTHPAHVPKILDLLRHQSTFNTLLTSCIPSEEPSRDCVSDLDCEVILHCNCSISVSFAAHDDSLALLAVNVGDYHRISCKLFPAALADPSTEEYLSRVLRRCMSIPMTMRALCRRLRKKPFQLHSLEVPSSTSDENDTLATSVSAEADASLLTSEEGGNVHGDA
ncbi:mediator of RNA polymerase II transcription subunit 1-like, partial [Arapaima gigas]